MLRKIALFAFVFSSCYAFSQFETKELSITRIDQPPKIDGILDEEIWKTLPTANDFFMLEPDNLLSERASYKTVVKMAYDNKAIYIGAYLYDHEPNKILKQFSQRDNIFVQADFFSVNINTLNDGINETVFMLPARALLAIPEK